MGVMTLNLGIPSPAGRDVRVLAALVAEHGKPRRLRADNGAEMTSTAFIEWC